MQPSQYKLSEAREKCLKDPIFLGNLLGYDILEKPHRELFDALGSGKSQRLVLWPRGHFKTSCVVVELVRRILNDPNIRILVMQSTLKLTKGWLKEIKSHFNRSNPKSRLHEVFPEFCARGLGDAYSFTVPARTRFLAAATVTAASPRAVQTGQHYTLMAFDDLVTANNFRSVELLDKLESEFSHFLPLLDPGGEVFVTGTRYSFADLYARLIAKDAGKDEWTKSIKECYLPDGSLLFPQTTTKDGRAIGFTLELLAKLKNDDPEMFVPQYLNKVMQGKDQLFPQTLLLAATKSSQDPEYPKDAPCVFVIDLAEGKRADADHSVLGVGRVDYMGRVWIVDVIGGQLSPHALAMTTVAKTVQYRPVRVLIEKQPGSEFFKAFLDTVAREKGVAVPTDFTSGGSKKNAKYMRVASLETPLRQKRLFLLAGIADYARLSEEFEQFPRGRHDDRPDCIALLYAALSAQVPFQPIVRKLPYFFDVPFVEPPTDTSSPLGDGFVC